MNGGFVMCRDLQGSYWYVGEGEWRFQISFSANQIKVLDNFKDWSIAGEGRDQKERKNIKIFSKKFKDHSDLEIFILGLKQTNEISIKEV
jgi:hypothetical protein